MTKLKAFMLVILKMESIQKMGIMWMSSRIMKENTIKG